MDYEDDSLIYVYILAPITIIVAVSVISYIYVQSRRLKEEMIQNGQLITIMPAFVTASNNWQHPPPPPTYEGTIPVTQISAIPIDSLPQSSMQTPPPYSPKGLPPPPPYTR